MTKIGRFEDLRCWQEARRLVKVVYLASNEGAFSKDFDMRAQIRRAAISVMNNIAEGFGRISNKEFIRFLEISSSSASEVKSISYLALDLSYWPEEKANEIKIISEKVKAMDLALIKYLQRTQHQRKLA